MPVLDRKVHRNLMISLGDRFENLKNKFDSRPLNSATEGTKGKGSWIKPDSKVATIGSSLELSMAIEDFKTILAEIKKLK